MYRYGLGRDFIKENIRSGFISNIVGGIGLK